MGFIQEWFGFNGWKELSTRGSIFATIFYSIFRNINKYLEQKKPWNTCKENCEDGSISATTLYLAAETLRIGTVLLYPIIPQKAYDVLHSINSSENLDTAFGLIPKKTKISLIKNIFPKIEL